MFCHRVCALVLTNNLPIHSHTGHLVDVTVNQTAYENVMWFQMNPFLSLSIATGFYSFQNWCVFSCSVIESERCNCPQIRCLW